MIYELSVKVDSSTEDGEVTIGADEVATIAMLAMLVHNVAEFMGSTDDELLELLAAIMEDEEGVVDDDC